MNPRSNPLLPRIIVALFLSWSSVAFALPKAAEDEEAQVTIGADAMRPKPSLEKQGKHHSREPGKQSLNKKKPVKTLKLAKKAKASHDKK